MKKYIALIVLAVFLSSCSISISDIPKSKFEYIKKVLVCDSKSTDFKIINQEDLVGFFDDEADSADRSSGRSATWHAQPGDVAADAPHFCVRRDDARGVGRRPADL